MDVTNDRFNYKGRLWPKYKLIENDGEEMVVPTPEWKGHLAQLKIKRYLSAAGIDDIPKYGLDSYIGEDKSKNIPKLKKYCEEFDLKFKRIHLYLWSIVNGTQKSTCAKDILVRLAGKGIQGYFILMDDLIHWLLKLGRDEAAEQKIKIWQNAPFLVIDECFTEGQVTLFSTGYQKAYINTFLKNRLEVNHRATCFTANIRIEDIGERWGPGLHSLISRSIPTPMLFDDTVDVSRFRNDDIWGDAK
jgi:DNA replication protein DnaC